MRACCLSSIAKPAIVRRVGRPPLGLKVASALANQHGGLCISDEYVSSLAPLEWQCHKGHAWKAKLNSIMHKGSWCPHCAGNARLNLNVAARVAAARSGHCLSKAYKNNKTPLHWRCAQGHEWKASLDIVKNTGTWCPHCSKAMRLSIDVAAKIAASNGGYCLSLQYERTRTHLRWQCAEGHEWDASLNSVKNQGCWCPQCSSGKSERAVRHIFETLFPDHSFMKCRPEFLRSEKGRRLELDGYCSTLKLAFEYQGEQHYDPNNFFNRQAGDAFASVVRRDRLKVLLCDLVGIRLVVVPCMVQDRWSFVRLYLLRWFTIGALNPIMLVSRTEQLLNS